MERRRGAPAPAAPECGFSALRERLLGKSNPTEWVPAKPGIITSSEATVYEVNVQPAIIGPGNDTVRPCNLYVHRTCNLKHERPKQGANVSISTVRPLLRSPFHLLLTRIPTPPPHPQPLSRVCTRASRTVCTYVRTYTYSYDGPTPTRKYKN